MNALQKIRDSGYQVTLADGEHLSITPPPPEAWVPRLKEIKPALLSALKDELPSELSEYEELKVRAWLRDIEESDPLVIGLVIDRCRNNMGYRLNFLRDAKEVEPITHPDRSRATTCDGCNHFRRVNRSKLGHCAKGQQEGMAGLWGSDKRNCGHWQALAPDTHTRKEGGK